MMLPLTSCCIEASSLTCLWMLRYSTSWKEENVAVQELDNSDLESLAFCSGKSMMRPNVNRHHHKRVSLLEHLADRTTDQFPATCRYSTTTSACLEWGYRAPPGAPFQELGDFRIREANTPDRSPLLVGNFNC